MVLFLVNSRILHHVPLQVLEEGRLFDDAELRRIQRLAIIKLNIL